MARQTKYVTYKDSSGKEKIVTEGSYQRAVKSGKVSAAQHDSAKGATSSANKIIEQKNLEAEEQRLNELLNAQAEERYKSGEWSREKYLETIKQNPSTVKSGLSQVTGQPYKGTPVPTVKSDAELMKDPVVQETARKLTGQAYLQGKLTTQQRDINLKQINQGVYTTQFYKTPAQERSIQEQASKQRVARTLIDTSLPLSAPPGFEEQSMIKQDIPYLPKDNNYVGLDQVSRIDEINRQRGIQLFTVDNEGFIQINPNLPIQSIPQAERLAEQYGIKVGGFVGVKREFIQTTPSTNVQYLKEIPEVITSGDKTFQYSPTENKYIDEQGIKYTFESDKSNITLKPAETLPEGYTRSERGIMKNNILYKEENGYLIPTTQYTSFDETDVGKNLGRLGLKTNIVIPEKFVKVGDEYILPKKTPRGMIEVKDPYSQSISKGLSKTGIKSPIKDKKIYLQENTGIYYEQTKNELIPKYSIQNNELYPIKKDSSGEYVIQQKALETTTPQTTKSDELKANLKELREYEMQDYSKIENLIPNEIKPIARKAYEQSLDIRDTSAIYATKFEELYEQSIDKQITSGANTLSNLFKGTSFEEPVGITAEFAGGFAKTFAITPTKVLITLPRSQLEYKLGTKQLIDPNVSFNISSKNILSGIGGTVEGGIYALPIATGVAGGLKGVLPKNSILYSPAKKSVMSPVITKATSEATKQLPTTIGQTLKPYASAAALGAGFGIAEVGFESIKAKETINKLTGIDLGTSKDYTSNEALRKIARTSGEFTGFVGVSQITSGITKGSVKFVQETIKTAPGKLNNLIFETKFVSINDPSLTTINTKNIKQYSPIIKLKTLKPTIRKIFTKDVIKQQGLDTNLLPLEESTYVGTQVSSRPIEATITTPTKFTFQGTINTPYKDIYLKGTSVTTGRFNLEKLNLVPKSIKQSKLAPTKDVSFVYTSASQSELYFKRSKISDIYSESLYVDKSIGKLKQPTSGGEDIYDVYSSLTKSYQYKYPISKTPSTTKALQRTDTITQLNAPRQDSISYELRLTDIKTPKNIFDATYTSKTSQPLSQQIKLNVELLKRQSSISTNIIKDINQFSIDSISKGKSFVSQANTKLTTIRPSLEIKLNTLLNTKSKDITTTTSELSKTKSEISKIKSGDLIKTKSNLIYTEKLPGKLKEQLPSLTRPRIPTKIKPTEITKVNPGKIEPFKPIEYPIKLVEPLPSVPKPKYTPYERIPINNIPPAVLPIYAGFKDSYNPPKYPSIRQYVQGLAPQKQVRESLTARTFGNVGIFGGKRLKGTSLDIRAINTPVVSRRTIESISQSITQQPKSKKRSKSKNFFNINW